jgi:hypothetical protein
LLLVQYKLRYCYQVPFNYYLATVFIERIRPAGLEHLPTEGVDPGGVSGDEELFALNGASPLAKPRVTRTASANQREAEQDIEQALVVFWSDILGRCVCNVAPFRLSGASICLSQEPKLIKLIWWLNQCQRHGATNCMPACLGFQGGRDSAGLGPGHGEVHTRQGEAGRAPVHARPSVGLSHKVPDI